MPSDVLEMGELELSNDCTVYSSWMSFNDDEGRTTFASLEIARSGIQATIDGLSSSDLRSLTNFAAALASALDVHDASS